MPLYIIYKGRKCGSTARGEGVWTKKELLNEARLQNVSTSGSMTDICQRLIDKEKQGIENPTSHLRQVKKIIHVEQKNQNKQTKQFVQDKDGNEIEKPNSPLKQVKKLIHMEQTGQYKKTRPILVKQHENVIINSKLPLIYKGRKCGTYERGSAWTKKELIDEAKKHNISTKGTIDTICRKLLQIETETGMQKLENIPKTKVKTQKTKAQIVQKDEVPKVKAIKVKAPKNETDKAKTYFETDKSIIIISDDYMSRSSLLMMLARNYPHRGTKEAPIKLGLSDFDVDLAFACLELNMIPAPQNIIKPDGFDDIGQLIEYIGFTDIPVDDYLEKFPKFYYYMFGMELGDVDWSKYDEAVHDQGVWFHPVIGEQYWIIEFPRKFLNKVPKLLDEYNKARMRGHLYMGSEEFPIDTSIANYHDLKIIRAICHFGLFPHWAQDIIVFDDKLIDVDIYNLRNETYDDKPYDEQYDEPYDDGTYFADMINYLNIDVDPKILKEEIRKIHRAIDFEEERSHVDYLDGL